MTSVEPVFLDTIVYQGRKLQKRESLNVNVTSEQCLTDNLPKLPTKKKTILNFCYILAIPLLVFISTLLRSILLKSSLVNKYVDVKNSMEVFLTELNSVAQQPSADFSKIPGDFYASFSMKSQIQCKAIGSFNNFTLFEYTPVHNSSCNQLCLGYKTLIVA